MAGWQRKRKERQCLSPSPIAPTPGTCMAKRLSQRTLGQMAHRGLQTKYPPVRAASKCGRSKSSGVGPHHRHTVERPRGRRLALDVWPDPPGSAGINLQQVLPIVLGGARRPGRRPARWPRGGRLSELQDPEIVHHIVVSEPAKHQHATCSSPNHRTRHSEATESHGSRVSCAHTARSFLAIRSASTVKKKRKVVKTQGKVVKKQGKAANGAADRNWLRTAVDERRGVPPARGGHRVALLLGEQWVPLPLAARRLLHRRDLEATRSVAAGSAACCV